MNGREQLDVNARGWLADNMCINNDQFTAMADTGRQICTQERRRHLRST
jgi:hypothetical protein